MKIVLEGDEKLKAFLASRPSKAMIALAGVLLEEAETAMKKSKDGLVPVAPDGGTLRDSGFIDQPEREGSYKLSVTLGYGGAATAYALAVHEVGYPGFPGKGKHPWTGLSGSDINWNVPGSGPKYLEKPVLEAQEGLEQRMAPRIRRRLERP